MMLDNFFRTVDTGSERIKIHGGASASETDAKENARRGGKPGVEGRSIKIKASGGGFGDITLEIGLIFGIFGLFWGSFR